MSGIAAGAGACASRRRTLAQNAIVEVNDLVGDGGHAFDSEGHQGRIAPLRLEFREVGRRHLPALAGDLQQAVVMHQALRAWRQIERLQGLQAFDVFEHVPRVRLGR